MAKPKYRSSPYPRLTVQYSFKMAELLLSNGGKDSVPETVMAKRLGYKGISGRSTAVLSALKKYKVIEPDGDDFRLSKEAVKFFSHGTTEVEQAEILERAFNAPKLFKDILSRFGGRADKTELAEYLTEKSFNPFSIQKVIKNFQQNYNYIEGYKKAAIRDYRAERTAEEVSKTKSEIDALSDEKFDSEVELGFNNRPVLPSLHSPQPSLTVKFSLSENAEAKVYFYGAIKISDVENLIKYLNIYKENLPAD